MRDKITVCINGRILKNIKAFDTFPIEFLSKLTFVFKKKSFVVDEIIFHVYILTFNKFKEDTPGTEIYFINSGKVFILHKKTMSFIRELMKDDYFGEIAFFSDLPR